jgi:hypothetical protein
MTASGFDTCPSVRMKSCREISGWAAGARTACRGRQDVGPAEIGVQGGDGLVPVDLRFAPPGVTLRDAGRPPAEPQGALLLLNVLPHRRLRRQAGGQFRM